MNKKMTIEETINGLQGMIQSKKYIEHDFDGVVDEDVCERAIELLKEQEPVEPNKTLDGNGNLWRDCGKCGGVLPKDAQYCPTCGKAVKWNAGNRR